MRLDADEYLSDELINEMKNTLKNINSEIVGITKKEDIFMNRWIKHGKISSLLLRLWKNLGQIEKNGWMNIIIKKGKQLH